jgi:hypothetical protein
MPLSKHVLFVHAMYPHKLPAYQAARRLGYRVTVVGPELPEWAAPFVDAYIAAGTDAAVLTDTVRLLAQHHARDPFDGVVTYWDHGVVACAAIGTALGLPPRRRRQPNVSEIRQSAATHWRPPALRSRATPGSVTPPRSAKPPSWSDFQRSTSPAAEPAVRACSTSRRRRTYQPLERSPTPS